jgi:long-chain acyl-CoA synthetase
LRLGQTLVATYRQFARQADARARQLVEACGVQPGDRVGLFARNSPDYLEALHAIWWFGGVATPINAKLHPREAAWIARDSGAVLMLTDSGAAFDAADLPDGCRELPVARAPEETADAADVFAPPVPRLPDDLAWLFYTSGTTGRPKGVMLSHRNLMMMSLAYAMDVDPVSPLDHVVYAAPISHGAGLYNFPITRGGACHVIPESGGFDPVEIEALAGKLGNLVFFAAPTMLKRQIDAARARGYRGEGIKSIIYGGGPMYAADIDTALAQFGPRFIQIYGQGEAPMTITVLPRDLVADAMHPDWRARRVSVGIAQAGVRLRVVDSAMKDLPAGEVGEILVSGDVVMRGYWNRPEATRETLVDGWLRTGDLGTLNADGFLTLTDRSKDVIISGGTNIYPREVEEVLLRHPAVSEVSVVGAPDPEWGEQVVAFIVATPGAHCAEDDLESWCKAEIASFKKPRRYEFVAELPKNSYGKVLKTALRERL